MAIYALSLPDDDECILETHSCSANGFCTNVFGSYTCHCSEGYSGSGEICSDINECNIEQHSCHFDASCMNTVGSYMCSCDGGFSGNGSQCADVDECNDTTHDCHDNATCTNMIGSYHCECVNGFAGNGTLCVGRVVHIHACWCGHVVVHVFGLNKQAVTFIMANSKMTSLSSMYNCPANCVPS